MQFPKPFRGATRDRADRSAGDRPLWSRAVAVAAAAVALLQTPSPAVADQLLPLSAAVTTAAKDAIVPVLERDGITSVGVLKFLAMEGSGPDARPSTRLGAINSDLASQFQIAILMNVSIKKPIAVLRNPSGVAEGIAGATHLTPEGQAKLFAAEYPVVVGAAGTRVRPDAFVFGIVQVAEDLQTATVDVRLIRRDVPEAAQLTVFTASLRADDLPAAGQSYVATRGLFTGGQVGAGATAATPEKVAERQNRLASLAADVRAGRRAFPLEDPDAPVTLSVTYDGIVQTIEYRDGGAFVAEPRQGQKVTITLKKTRTDGQRYAVALKVNGENTAERGVLPDIKGRKWILSDDYMTLPVRGYSVGTDSVQPFTVLSEVESARRAFDYGVDAGTITMTVFAEQTGTPDAPTPALVAPPIAQGGGSATAALDQLLLAGGVRLDPKQTFESLDKAKSALGASLASTNRGLIVVSGESRAFKQRIVKFQAIPDPVMSAVIRYYTKR